MSDRVEDIEMLQRFQNEEPLAEKYIFHLFYKPLCLFANNIITQLPAAEDIVSEIFLKSFEKRSQFASINSLKAFLYISVRNACLNYLQAQKRQATTLQQLEYLADLELVALPNDVQNEVLLAEIIQAIHLEIDELPDKCGVIFKKIFFEGQPTNTIAHELGINVQTVRTQKARAIQLVKTGLLRRSKISALTLLCVWVNAIDAVNDLI